jgi:hypothetical protein
MSPRVAAKNKWARIEALLRNRGSSRGTETHSVGT